MNKLLLQIALLVKPYVEAYRILILNDIQLVLAKKKYINGKIRLFMSNV